MSKGYRSTAGYWSLQTHCRVMLIVEYHTMTVKCKTAINHCSFTLICVEEYCWIVSHDSFLTKWPKYNYIDTEPMLEKEGIILEHRLKYVLDLKYSKTKPYT